MNTSKEYSPSELKFLEVANKVCAETGIELYDLEYVPGNATLRVFIINPETKTATLEECANVDRAFTPHIEANEWMPENLTLEVSSPGMFRHLTMLKHFEAVVGEQIKIHLHKPLCGTKKYVGILNMVSADEIELQVKEEKIKIPFTELKKANLEPNI